MYSNLGIIQSSNYIYVPDDYLWKMQETSGTTMTGDTSSRANGIDGAYNGTVSNNQTGPSTYYAKGYNIDRTAGTNYVELNNTSAADLYKATPFTISFWYKQTYTTGYKLIINKTDPSGVSADPFARGWYLFSHEQGSGFGFIGNTNDTTQEGRGTSDSWWLRNNSGTSYHLATGNWRHVVYTYDPADNPKELNLWVDGTKFEITTYFDRGINISGRTARISTYALSLQPSMTIDAAYKVNYSICGLHIFPEKKLSQTEIEDLYDLESA